MFNQITCPDAIPGFLNFFDFSIAPTLLFYSYIPIILISLFFSFFIFFKNKYSLQSKLLLIVTLSFSIWVLDQVVQWTAIYVSAVHFSWQIIALFEMLVFIFSLYFVAVFLNKKDIDFKYKLLLGAVFLPIVVFLPTNLNINSFDLQQCQSNYSFLWEYIYIFEVSAIVIMMYMFYKKFRSLAKGDSFRKQIVILALGIFLFLGMFTATNIIGDSILVYEFNLIGPIGMVAFVALLAFMILKFKTFNIKLISAQALVFALGFLVLAILFIRKIENIRIVVIFTLLFVIVLGYALVKSVKKEIQAKENEKLQHIKFEELAGRFENINHILAHDVKNTLGKNKDIFVELIAGTFGEITDQGKNFLTRLTTDTRDLIDSVANILKAGDKIKPNPQPFDFKEAVLEAIKSSKDKADEEKIKIETQIDEKENYTVNADLSLIVPHVLKNLIENAVNYNDVNGSIWISLSKKDPKTVLLVIKGTGWGMTEDDKDSLFKQGGHGVDSIKKNVHTTGFGLFIAKQTMDAHNGKIYGISEGRGKGSTFSVELPVDFTPVVSETPKI